ncbi:unnamed protein product [Urochloa humidicola]
MNFQLHTDAYSGADVQWSFTHLNFLQKQDTNTIPTASLLQENDILLGKSTTPSTAYEQAALQAVIYLKLTYGFVVMDYTASTV